MTKPISSKLPLSRAPVPVRLKSTSTLSSTRDTDMMQLCARVDAGSQTPLSWAIQAPAATNKVPPETPKSREPPERFTCPISKKLMSDPVLCNDGRVYDRNSVKELKKSPFTGLPIKILGPIVTLRTEIWEAYPKQEVLYIRPADSSYSGEKDARGMPQGKGIRTYKNGTVEEGQFEAGILQQGSRTRGNGNCESGTFVDEKLHGTGFRTFAIGFLKGQVHSGTFEQGLFVQGTIKEPSGGIYVGACKNGLAEGQGELTWAGGDKYVGAFKNGMIEGQGELTRANRDKNVGAFKLGMAEGQGESTCANGDKYVGAFKNGTIEGQGELTWLNGDKYVGAFKLGMAEGQGELTWANGSKYVGAFKRDKFDGQGVCAFADGRKYDGTFKNHNFDGQGVFTWPNGACFVGIFRNHKRYESTSSKTTLAGRWKTLSFI